MKIFLRGFNRKINSKSGAVLPQGQYRGTEDWLKFESLMIDCLNGLGHDVEVALENGINQAQPNLPCDKRIYWHRNRRDEEADLYLMQMHMRDLFTVDTNGWGFNHSELKECLSNLEDKEDSTRFCQELSDKLHASGESKIAQPSITDATPEKFILVPIQTPRDYTITNHSPITVKYFIESIVAWAAEAQYHACFKMHPKNTNDHDLISAIQYGIDGSRYIHKVEGNIHELTKRSMGLFVINSGTGFEALIHGKPVATFGDCDYNRVTFNADIRRLDEARNFLYGWTKEQAVIAYKFLYWYYHRHAYCLSLPNTKERLTAYLKESL